MFSVSRTENENAKGTLLEMKLGTSGGCPKQQDSERVAGPAFGRECEMQPVNASTTSKGNDVGTGDHGMVFANLLQNENENLRTHIVNSTMKLTESCNLNGKIENMVATKSKGEMLALGKPPHGILTDGKRKAPCLFEMLTLPSKSQATYFNDSISPGICSLGAQKQFTTKTDTLYSGTGTGTNHASGEAIMR